MRKVLGIDLGSRTIKIVELSNGRLTHAEIFDTGHDPLARVENSLRKLGKAPIVATGYGRHLLGETFQARRVTEIKACGKGVVHFFPECRTILDVGGQDCKVISLDEEHRIKDFEMNDRCAAGTGRFLEFMAQTLDVDITDFVRLASSAKGHIAINSMCTVFAESEVVSLITSGKPRDQIALGLHVSIAERLDAMLRKISPEEDIVFVGGGAKNVCLHRLLEARQRTKIYVPEEPQLVSAIGAALLDSDE
ncbi:MAG: acyl-CoA dehydratase activase [Candidatus Aminicenantales bacterium]